MSSGKKLSLWIGLSCGLICLLGVGIPLWRLLNGPDSLDRAIDRYRRDGLPWTAGDVQPIAGMNADDNAAPLLLQAATPLTRTGPTSKDDAWGYALAGKDDAASAILARFRWSLAEAKRAAAKPYANFGKDWDLGPQIVFPELVPIRNLGRMLLARAVVEAREGQVEASNSDIFDAYRISRLIGQEPTIISLLIELTLRLSVANAVEQAVYAYRDNEPALHSLKPLVESMQDPPDFALAFRGESYMHLAILRNGALYRRYIFNQTSDGSELPPVDPRLIVRTGKPSGFIERIMGGKVVGTDARIYEAAKQDAGDFGKLDTDLRAIDREVEADTSLNGKYRAVMVPVFAESANVVREMQAAMECDDALVEAALIRRRSGRLPTRIAEIRGHWIDPFDGKPLRLKLKAGQLRIYSIGRDGVDDGGLARNEARSMDHYDVVVAFPPIAHKPPK